MSTSGIIRTGSLESSAVIKGPYRYDLLRNWQKPKKAPCLVWVMLNPSKADAANNDATINRVTAYSKEFGYSGALVYNLFAYRATDPKELRDVAKEKGVLYATGPKNNHYLRWGARYAYEKKAPIVCAWGAHQMGVHRARDVASLFRGWGNELFCLGVNKDGSPKHPLYLRGDAEMIAWEGPQ